MNSQLPWLFTPEGHQRLVPILTVIWGWTAATHTTKVMTDGQGKPHQWGQLSFLTFICVSTMHRGCPYTVNSPVYSNWKNYICCGWIMFYIKAQSVRQEPGLPPTHISCDINTCDSPFSCSYKKPSDISYKIYSETYLSSEKNVVQCLIPIAFFFFFFKSNTLSQSNAFCTKLFTHS